ncbi:MULTISPECIES: hypothetical protein [unclassified Candidatus Tisiphia]|jgi:hypothetical protein|uniref:hypothetical protein n=1 Tax=unclassified Candidatus Tisiphia TaxID=2996318 RepID=UPI001E7DF467|nr:MAG: hypothetical protein LF884_06550 [Rickettsia endosymbiont of Cimex lectularius]
MFSKYIVNIFLFIIMLILSSCSVYKAASNEGISVSDITKCQTKGCFLSHGMEIVDRHQEENGKYMETYRAMARKSGLNYLRAAGHGVLDVVTLGVWEVAGTPVEGAISNNRGYITARVTYPYKEAEKLEKIEIYDANGKRVK